MIRHLVGTVAELHGRDPFAAGPFAEPEVCEPEVWWCDFTDAAIVLGSSQSPDVLDADAVAAAGLSVVRRRSGGGAVLMRPGSVVWIDLAVPAGTPGWPDDVRASMVAAGELWRAALGQGFVHRGGMVATPWSPLVCFAGVGPGEVLAGGRKLVGLSQRRTRHGARIQGLVHTAPLVAETARFVPTPPAAELATELPEAAVARVAPEALARALDNGVANRKTTAM